MTTITWKIESLERRLQDGAVQVAHWRLNGSDGDTTESVYGTVSLPEPDPQNFIPYEALTEATAIGWVKAQLGEERVAALEAQVTGLVAARAAPTTAHGTPWA